MNDGDDDPRAKAQAEVEALKASFAAQLDDRVRAIEVAAAQLAEAGTPDAALRAVEDVLALAHRLAGSAGTFGFHALGDGAAALEESCQAVRDGTGDLTAILDRTVDLRSLAGGESQILMDASEGAVDATGVGGETGSVLLVEDDPDQARTYQTYLADGGYTVTHADLGKKALAVLDRMTPDAVLLDLALPDMDGLDILKHLSESGNQTPIIVITARSSVNAAVEAMRLDAFDYIVKPFSAARILVTLRNALQHRNLSRKVEVYQTLERDQYCDFIGASLPMQAVYRIIDSAAGSKATVFITGESGTGKEVCAQAIHQKSARATGPFMALNCGAIPRDLMESEIFGHVKGAFTGAVADRDGAARRAHGGTLFLDEVCEMDLQLQTKLLRFLQTGSFEKVGGAQTEHVDVRIVCATNRDPLAEVAAGRFREDLFYRLHVIPIHMPPLRERGDDIGLIAQHFLRQYAAEEGKGFGSFSPEAESAFTAYAWPGNVRQLQNVIRSVVVLNEGELVTPDMVPGRLEQFSAASSSRPSTPTAPTVPLPAAAMPTAPEIPVDLAQAIRPMAQVERETIEQAIDLCEGDVAKAAHYLGIHASTIYRKKTAWQKGE